MSNVWRFNDVQFVALWDQLKDGVLPEPFTFVSKQPYLHEFREELARYRTRLAELLGDTFDGVLEIVAQPDVRVVVEAYDENKPDDPNSRLRLLGGARANRAYMVKQLPGETIWHSGGFLVGEFETKDLGEAAVAEMPVVGAGSWGDVVLPGDSEAPDTVDHSFFSGSDGAPEPGEPVVDPAASALRRRADSFLAAPTTMVGSITVIQGRSKFGPRGITRHRVHWRDVADDGRYLITEELSTMATGVSPRQVADAVDARIRKVLAILAGEGLREA